MCTGGAPNKVLKAEELAEVSALSVATVRRAELRESETSLTMANDLAIGRALESAGVEFIDENGGGPGVRLTEAPTEERMMGAVPIRALRPSSAKPLRISDRSMAEPRPK